MLSAIIVAAGSSRRMGFDKLFAPLSGKPVLWHSIRAFARCPQVDEVLVVTRAERLEEVRVLLADAAGGKRGLALEGGAERHLSVWASLQAISSQNAGQRWVAVHDGARPLIEPSAVSDCLEVAKAAGAACCAAPVPDTVKRVDASMFVSESVDREGLWAMQTPQIFALSLILEAYTAVLEAGQSVTDEVSAVQTLGRQVKMFRLSGWNFKITYPEDLAVAEQVLAARSARAGGGE